MIQGKPYAGYDLKEKLDKLEKEFYRLHDWFGRYDQLIWKMRGLLFTIFAAIIVYSFNTHVPGVKVFGSLAVFALFFLMMEIFWLATYWARRTSRYKLIQDVMNSGDEARIKQTRLLDMEMHSANDKKVGLIKKIDEPVLFYFGLIGISAIIIFLI